MLFIGLICIGLNACSMATTQKCSIALGDNTQFPEGLAGDHILITPGNKVIPLYYLNHKIVIMVEKEITRVNGLKSILDPNYIKQWNKNCSRKEYRK